MKQAEAIEALRKAIDEIANLKNVRVFSAEHIRWLSNTTSIIEDVFGRGSGIFLTFVDLRWEFRGTFISDRLSFEANLKTKNRETYLQSLEIARGLIESGIDLIERKGIESVSVSAGSNEIIKIISLIDTKLRKLIREKPEKEKDILDALEALFIGAGLDNEYLREKIEIPYSSKTYIPDFVFERVSTVVEGKLCDSATREKEIIAEINDDIFAYNTKYRNLVFVVYDVGIIRDQDLFKGSIETHENVVVIIVKH